MLNYKECSVRIDSNLYKIDLLMLYAAIIILVASNYLRASAFFL